MLRYKCLVLDHDDTTVDSTRVVNYPQFCSFFPTIRSGRLLTYDEYRIYCNDYGFYEMCRKFFAYTEEEMEIHVADWKKFVMTHTAPFFPGIPELIRRFRAEGGYICVISHSYDDTIRHVYDRDGVPLPDLIFGAELPEDRQKPNPWPLLQTMERLHLEPKDLLLVDDALLGGKMAQSCGVRFAAAAWCEPPEPVERQLRAQCDIFLPTVSDLEKELFADETEKT